MFIPENVGFWIVIISIIVVLAFVLLYIGATIGWKAGYTYYKRVELPMKKMGGDEDDI